MKVLASLVFLFSFGFAVQAQDFIYLHNGTQIKGKVIRSEEFTIVFRYDGEDAEQTISKRAVEKINYASGRSEDVTERIIIRGKDDWEKVEILLDRSEIVGLKKINEVQGKTMGAFSGYTSAAGSDKRANRKLLEAAAAMGCPFVYMTADKDAKGGMQTGAYGNQSLKKGIAYTY